MFNATGVPNITFFLVEKVDSKAECEPCEAHVEYSLPSDGAKWSYTALKKIMLLVSTQHELDWHICSSTFTMKLICVAIHR
jgi:hypothetical protein